MQETIELIVGNYSIGEEKIGDPRGVLEYDIEYLIKQSRLI